MSLIFLVRVAPDISDTKGPDSRNVFHTSKSNTIGGYLIPTNLPLCMFCPLTSSKCCCNQPLPCQICWGLSSTQNSFLAPLEGSPQFSASGSSSPLSPVSPPATEQPDGHLRSPNGDCCLSVSYYGSVKFEKGRQEAEPHTTGQNILGLPP